MSWMRTGNGLTCETVIPLIHEKRGNLSRVAQSLGCSRNHLYGFIHAHTSCQEAVEESRERLIDRAEERMEELMEEGGLVGYKATQFLLSTRGRKRGYGRELGQEQDVEPEGEP